MLAALEIEAIQRGTVAAVSPDAVEEWPGWLLPFSAGTIQRARSAVPLQHDGAAPDAVARIEARYHARDLPPRFRLPDAGRFDPMREELQRCGYRDGSPILIGLDAPPIR